MRLPNNYGSVYKLKGNRRKPFVARKTIGYNTKDRQIYKCIGYFETREDALQSLATYNNAPYNIDLRDITFKDLYNKWISRKELKVEINEMAENSLKFYKNVFKNHCQSLHNKAFIKINTSDLQKIIDGCNCGFTIKRYIKGLYNQLYDFANELDIPVKKNYAKFVDIGKDEQSDLHINIEEKDINILWDNLNIADVDLILIMIYTGLRPNELLNIEIKNVFLDKRYMIGGSKTDAGIDRIIPIHEKIVPLIEKRLNNSKKYLVTNTLGFKYTYQGFKKIWDNIMSLLNLNYLPYDCRHTCATRLDNTNANKLCIKLILGHKVNDITDKVYTHKNYIQLVETINLLT